MWSRPSLTHFWASMLLAALSASAFGAPKSVCPVFQKKTLVHIELFDGQPESQAFLAPDNDAAGSNLYSVGAIYDRGDLVVVRCKYSQGKVVTVPLSKRVAICTYKEDRRKVPALYCK